jgi:hypothetical protein
MAKRLKNDPLIVIIMLILVATVTFALAKLSIEKIDSIRNNKIR